MWIISNDFTERAATTIFGSQAWWWRWSRRWWWHQRRLTMVLGEAKQRICVVPVANGRPRVRWKYNRRLCWIFVPNSWSKMKRPLPLPCWSAQLKDSHLDLQSQTFMFRFKLFSHIGGKVYWNKLHESSSLRWNGKDLFVLLANLNKNISPSQAVLGRVPLIVALPLILTSLRIISS